MLTYLFRGHDVRSEIDERRDECYSPELVNTIDDDEVIDPELDLQKLEEERRKVSEREAERLLQQRALAMAPASEIDGVCITS